MSNQNNKQDNIDKITTEVYKKQLEKSTQDDKKIKQQEELIKKLTAKIKKQEENYILLQRTTDTLFNQQVLKTEEPKGTTAEDAVNRIFKKKT